MILFHEARSFVRHPSRSRVLHEPACFQRVPQFSQRNPLYIERTSFRAHQPSALSSVLPPDTEISQGFSDSKQPNRSRIVSAALLIAGITVGGGFLALPTVVAPVGFFPSALTLVGVWVFLGAQALMMVEVLCRVHRDLKKGGQSTPPGVAAAARATFGKTGEYLITFLLVLVVEATLISQISRAGMMFPPSLYRVGCSLAALSVATVIFGPGSKNQRENIATSLNSILTVVFFTMAILLFVLGVPAAEWSRLSTVQNYKSLPQVVPTFLQLLVYGEILPSICQYLNFQKRPIRWAIGLGSILPLILELGWAALGSGLNPNASGSLQDPVALLLQTGPIQTPLFCLALSAILTTILGSYLALESTIKDTLPVPSNGKRHSRFLSASLIVLPALAIASISPSLFLQAIDFAGSYPVLLLWGIGPPAMAMRLRHNDQSTSTTNGKNVETLPKWWIKTLLGVSILLFGMSAVPDMLRIAAWGWSLLKCLFH